jgi:ribonuclease P protein component
MKRLSFPKKKRLVSNSQFKAVMARGRRLSNGVLTLYMVENDCKYSRLGVSVGKSHGNAVVRNRLKRLMREAFRQNQERIPVGFDYLLMIRRSSPVTRDPCPVRRATKRPTFEQVKASFLALANSPLGTRDS